MLFGVSYCFRKWSASSEKDIVAMRHAIASDGAMHKAAWESYMIAYFPLKA